MRTAASLGWIVAPQRRRFLDFRWNGRLGSRRIWDGSYRIRLVDGLRVLATSPLRIDQTPARLLNIHARNRDRMPFQGDKKRFTTISPNGDKLRESAKIGFTLDEPAQVHFEVTRTLSSPTAIYELWANLKPGRHTFTWFPHWSIGARTYLIRLSTLDKAGNRRTYGADNARAGRRLSSAVVRVLGVDAGFTAESYVASSAARLAIETDATSLTLQTFRAGGEDTRTHSDTLMNGVPVDQPVTIEWKARHRRATPQPRARPVADRRLLRQADRERRPDRLRARSSIRPTTLGERSRVAVVMPTNTWQAYNFRDSRRQRLGRHLVREGRTEHRRARPDVHPPRACRRNGASTTSTSSAGSHATGKQPDFVTETDLEIDPHRRRADPALRLRPLPRPHRVRDAARVRPDPELPRPRRQPRVPLREQLLLAGAAAGPDTATDAALARHGTPGVVAARRPVPR